ncbi:RNA-binding S4 domain-containing protein [Jannaschia sp. W003]|uniref:RNA-binding S4 domain-containing protein n=1 Tax=Jannaschia sp. W003 TaxID=2867012 RepID=UPI0021A69A14|nr:RNA-binding S4 domain-containing protein [Jannaschia sp. W003]UWQ23042.1 RNA-binding S4 domain-containing protein [Jannaschia sp. W003]
MRVDKWLWHARFFKTRSLAARMVGEGGVRVNGARIEKSSHAVGPGDTLTFSQGRQVRVVEVAALGTRRGPAEEAQALFVDHSPAPVPRAGPRPTGRERRRLDADRQPSLEPPGGRD